MKARAVMRRRQTKPTLRGAPSQVRTVSKRDRTPDSTHAGVTPRSNALSDTTSNRRPDENPPHGGFRAFYLKNYYRASEDKTRFLFSFSERALGESRSDGLPSKVSECLVGVCHAVHILLLFDRVAFVLSSQEEFCSKLFCHWLTLLATCGVNEPAE